MHCSADLDGGVGPDPDEESTAGVVSRFRGVVSDALGGGDEVGQPDRYQPEPVQEADGDGTATEQPTASEHPTATGETGSGETDTAARSKNVTPDGSQVLDPDGTVDTLLTIAVGIGGGLVVGLLGMIVLGALTGSGWAVPFGVLVWLGATVYIGRQRSVQGAIAKTGFATAGALALIPLWAVSPFGGAEGGLLERAGLFVTMFVGVAVPAGFAAGVGWIASRFTPE